MKLSGKAPIQPTEDPEKVKESVIVIFPDAQVKDLGSETSFMTDRPEKFIELMHNQRIRDTAVTVFRAGLTGDATSFHLGKQAAFAGKVNFTEGNSTLGDIHILVEEGALELIDMTMPRT